MSLPETKVLSPRKRKTFIEGATSPSSIHGTPRMSLSLCPSAHHHPLRHEGPHASGNKQTCRIIVFVSIFLYLFVQPRLLKGREGWIEGSDGTKGGELRRKIG